MDTTNTTALKFTHSELTAILRLLNEATTASLEAEQGASAENLTRCVARANTEMYMRLAWRVRHATRAATSQAIAA